ncbi:RWD domain-containing protein isoform 1 [Schistosoma japonicum]|uniref:RWD domain-containing protein isoform 1 n=1 Tax=Schistosoma japonicum TaxID=6182 RepID=A0A4Z2DLW9_SCHJA|nr:RWD domain-containing protein isoform 1 [Schistosoma japonicum]
MAVCDLREEEAQVLKSIFSEDELTISGDYKLEYKVGEHGTISSFVIQIQWPTGYPNVMPYISMDCFYNQHVPQDVKEKIVAELVSVAEDQLGSALTYILVEYIKENHERFVKWFSIEKVDKSQPDSISNEASVGIS